MLIDVSHHLPIDVDFDMRTDTPEGRDPDSHSPTLRQYHKALWSKPLPNGEYFELRTDVPRVYLFHESRLGKFFLSSDTVATSHRKRLNCFYTQLPAEANERFHRIGYTIGGMLIFPGNRIDGKQTINQRRGTHRSIQDRLDLTLECIRLHYRGEQSPLSTTLDLHGDFFNLFETFRQYIEFFLLQDLVTDRFDVDFLLPFDGFDTSPLPTDFESYAGYCDRTIAFVEARNRRIANL
ncbi:hypothetical protein [Homoserinimonas sp. OAct 916]|uniref:DUF6994 family protein n=1 Tax=Homoserinimonas sp. OAct 916 TaxID=2211450 RepID=UPI000DBE441E|nr:hypothetical protein [Homoserinimonas sp. OAct 916]